MLGNIHRKAFMIKALHHRGLKALFRSAAKSSSTSCTQRLACITQTWMSCSPLICWQGWLECLQEVLFPSTAYPKKPERQLMCLVRAVPSLLNPLEKGALLFRVTHSSSPSPAPLSEMIPAQATSCMMEGEQLTCPASRSHSVLVYARTDARPWLFLMKMAASFLNQVWRYQTADF